jgi:hypothetical protein
MSMGMKIGMAVVVGGASIMLATGGAPTMSTVKVNAMDVVSPAS